MRVLSLTIALLATAAMPGAVAKPKAPTPNVVRALVTESFGTPAYESGGQTAELTFKKVKVLKGRKSHPNTDHVKPNKQVWPARAVFTQVVRGSDGKQVGVTHTADLKMLIYKDDFGDWVYNNVAMKWTPPLGTPAR